jgi:predicted NAD/FAD-dependent oxidoreductase
MGSLSERMFHRQRSFEQSVLLSMKSDQKFLFPVIGDQGRPRPNVAVIGGGACGLTAARDLLNQGATVSIFEASGRLGGRLFSVDVMGHAVDVGASYCHGCSDVWRCVPYRFAIERADPDGVCCPWLEDVAPLPFCSVDRRWGGYSESWGTSPWRTVGGSEVSPITISRISSTVLGCMSRCPLDVQRDPSSSVRDAFQAGFTRSRQSIQKEIDKEPDLVEMALRLRWGYVSDPGHVSAVDVYGDSQYGGSVFGRHVPSSSQTSVRSGSGHVGLADDGLVRVGFDKLIVEGLQPQPSETASGRARVYLQLPVSSISAVGQVSDQPHVEVGTKDGVVRSFDYAICTVSIGVLQACLVPGGPMQFWDKRIGSSSNYIFPPSLASNLGHLGMGCETKVLLVFSSRWWPDEPRYRYFLCASMGYRFMSLDDYGVPGALVVHLSPPASLGLDAGGAVEDSCGGVWNANHQLVGAILQALASMFPQFVKRVPGADLAALLTSAYVSRWDANELCRGSYAFHRPGYSMIDSMQLVNPRPDIQRGPIFFAGEGLADHEHGFQCVEGAMCSGLHAARSLIELWDRFCSEALSERD